MRPTRRPKTLTPLSAREHEVTTHVLDGLTNKEIARKLQITEGTIKIHLNRVYHKLGVKGRYALALRMRKARDGPSE